MGLHLYCIVPAGHRPPAGLLGLDDAPVGSADASSCGVWTSRAERRPEPRLERLRRHDRVVRAALREEGTALPVRFGQWFPSEEALRTRVEERAERYRKELGDVRGCLEFGVRVLLATGGGEEGRREPPGEKPAPPGAGRGRAYLEELARRRAAGREASRRAEAVATELEAHLGPLVRRHRVERLPGDEGLLGVAHLVPREEVPRYRRALEAFGRDRPELRLRPHGPWPPYSFVS